MIKRWANWISGGPGGVVGNGRAADVSRLHGATNNPKKKKKKDTDTQAEARRGLASKPLQESNYLGTAQQQQQQQQRCLGVGTGLAHIHGSISLVQVSLHNAERCRGWDDEVASQEPNMSHLLGSTAWLVVPFGE